MSEQGTGDGVYVPDPAPFAKRVGKIVAAELMRKHRVIAYDALGVPIGIDGDQRCGDFPLLTLAGDLLKEVVDAGMPTGESCSVVLIAERLDAKPHLFGDLVPLVAEVAE